MNTPQAISIPEWEEIMALPVVNQGWGLTQDETAEWFSSWVYGVKFDFVSSRTEKQNSFKISGKSFVFCLDA